MKPVVEPHVMNDLKRIADEGILIEDVSSMPVYNEPYTTPNYVFCINHSGHMDAEYDSNRVVFKPHDVSVVYPNHIICAHSSSPDYHATVIVMSAEKFATVSNHVAHIARFEYDQNPACTLSEEQYRDMMIIVEALRTMSRLETPMRMDILQAFLLSLMEMLHVFRYGTSDRHLHMQHNSLSRRFHDAVIEHCHEHHDVAFYAEYFNLTPKYFSSLIRSETGHSASHWISIYVVSQAKMLMRTQTNATLQQIGNMLGFTEQSNFSRYFKRETGLAPEVWRKQQFARKR